jgi:hypothetical protein
LCWSNRGFLRHRFQGRTPIPDKGSAFPTEPGVNPMISIMSLAHRTATNMVTDS